MFRAVAFILGCCSMGITPTVAQDKPAALPQDRFPGEWVNTDKDTRGTKRLGITKKGDGWEIESWSSVSKTEERSAGKVKLSLHGDGVSAKELPYGFATWESKISTRHKSLKIEKDELVVEQFNIFTPEAAKGRSDYRTVERFKKK